MAMKPAWFSFGGTAAIVTSMGLIFGLEAAASTRQAIVSALLIVALADNLSDSLSVHVYQEAENLDSREAFRSTLANFVTRLLVALSFVALVLLAPRDLLSGIAIAWGFALLSALTFRIARARKRPVAREIAKHIAIALVVLAVSRALGTWISSYAG
jgi:VIT1/CCC1 family predicted Fe2+/Mn2+ transporter